MKKQEKYKVIATLVAGLLLFSYLGHSQALELVSFGILAVSAASSWMAEKISWAWMKFAEGIGFVMQRVLLSVVYFVFLTPMAILYRTFNKNALQLKRTTSGTYYANREHDYKAKDLEHPW